MKKRHFISLGFIALIALWMVSGQFISVSNQQQKKDNHASLLPKKANETMMQVEVADSFAEAIDALLVSEGMTMPKRELTLRAETTGKIKTIHQQEGQFVAKDALLLSLYMDDRDAKLQQAEALVAEHEQKQQAQSALNSKGYSAKTHLYEAKATLKTELASLAHIRLDIAHTKIKAPFDSIVAKKLVEEGEFVRAGTALLQLVDNNPLVVSLDIPQKKINAIALNEKVNIQLATGEKLQGNIQFIAPKANAATRTFEVKVDIPNPKHLRAGISATATIVLDKMMAHAISPALLTLNSNGDTGIKVVDGKHRVKFYPVHIVHAEKGGLWVSGLPAHIKIIKTGQGFVNINDFVAVKKQNNPLRKKVLATKPSKEA